MHINDNVKSLLYIRVLCAGYYFAFLLLNTMEYVFVKNVVRIISLF